MKKPARCARRAPAALLSFAALLGAGRASAADETPVLEGIATGLSIGAAVGLSAATVPMGDEGFEKGGALGAALLGALAVGSGTAVAFMAGKATSRSLLIATAPPALALLTGWTVAALVGSEPAHPGVPSGRVLATTQAATFGGWGAWLAAAGLGGADLGAPGPVVAGLATSAAVGGLGAVLSAEPGARPWLRIAPLAGAGALLVSALVVGVAQGASTPPSAETKRSIVVAGTGLGMILGTGVGLTGALFENLR